MAGITAVTSAIRDEATKWRWLAIQIDVVHQAANSLTLGPAAFFVGDATTELHAYSYDELQRFMTRVLHEAASEFDQVAAALLTIADRYDEAEQVIDLDLDKIYRP